MKTHSLRYLLYVVLVFALGTSGPAVADPPGTGTCDQMTGDLFGLCNAFMAQNCANVSKHSCDVIAANFLRKAGYPIPPLQKPSISVAETMNGLNNTGNSTPPKVAVGDPVNWGYHITNTGNVAVNITSVTSQDDVATLAATAPPSAVCNSPLPFNLAVGAALDCSATETAQIGTQVNEVTVQGIDPYTQTTVSAGDTGAYFGVVPLQIGVTTKVPTIPVGQSYGWILTFTNAGDGALDSIQFTPTLSGGSIYQIQGNCPTTLAAHASGICYVAAYAPKTPGLTTLTINGSANYTDTSGDISAVTDTGIGNITVVCPKGYVVDPNSGQCVSAGSPAF